MFVVKNNEKLMRAKAKAREERPAVRVRAFGSYEVEGSAGNFYAVTVHTFGQCLGAHCACVAGQYGGECYHAAAALEEHSRLSDMPAAQTAPARDSRLALVASDLRFIARRADQMSGEYEAADDICRAVRAALTSLGEYEDSINPAGARPAAA